jgi:hypothetical protein
MILKSRNLQHAEERINLALGIDDTTMIQCRERIFFSHFANSLQAIELFSDPDSAPREMVTVTGDLQRCLQMINNQEEYEITLLNFMSYYRLAQEAFAHWKFENDPENSKEDKLKLELFKMLKKLKESHDKEDKDSDDNDVNSDIQDTDDIIKRVDQVKKSNYNFSKYMELMGFKMKVHSEVDDMLRGLFSDNDQI